MTSLRTRAAIVPALAAIVALALSGCVKAPMESTLPALVEERVSGSYDVTFRAGSTATPGLTTIDLSVMLDREPVTAADLTAIIDAVFETNTMWAVYNVDVRIYKDEPDDLRCLDLAPALEELGLSRHGFDNFGCTVMVADFSDLRDWWEEQK